MRSWGCSLPAVGVRRVVELIDFEAEVWADHQAGAASGAALEKLREGQIDACLRKRPGA